MIRIVTASVFVDDQSKALGFYTEVLGFILKTDIPAGDFRWLTVASKDESQKVELLLEPNNNPAAATFQAAIKAQGIPAASFGVDDVHAEYERMSALGATFVSPPTDMGPVITAVLDDTCGNLIKIAQLR